MAADKRTDWLFLANFKRLFAVLVTESVQATHTYILTRSHFLHADTKHPGLFNLSKHDFLSYVALPPGVSTGHTSSCPAVCHLPDNCPCFSIMSAQHLVKTTWGTWQWRRTKQRWWADVNVHCQTFSQPVNRFRFCLVCQHRSLYLNTQSKWSEIIRTPCTQTLFPMVWVPPFTSSLRNSVRMAQSGRFPLWHQSCKEGKHADLIILPSEKLDYGSDFTINQLVFILIWETKWREIVLTLTDVNHEVLMTENLFSSHYISREGPPQTHVNGPCCLPVLEP